MYTLYKKGTTDKKKTASNGINFYKKGRCTSPRTIFFNLNESLCLIMSEFREKASDTQPNFSSF